MIADDVPAAHRRLHERPERVRRRLALRPGTTARGRARAFVDRVCTDWDVPDLAADARRITAELVRLTRTPAVLTVTLGAEGMRIALRDLAPSPVPAVVGRSSSWEVTPRSDGKAVWAVLPRAS